jgi:hypothetical protein
MVVLGSANRRLKDFYDIWALARSFESKGDALARAIARRSPAGRQKFRLTGLTR